MKMDVIFRVVLVSGLLVFTCRIAASDECDADFPDINVTVVGTKSTENFRLQRLILAMSSDVWFEQLYPNDGTLPGNLTIDGMEPSTFRRVLTYMYEGNADVTSTETWGEMWQAGLGFKIHDLQRRLSNSIFREINSDNVLEKLETAAANGDYYMEKMCMQVIDIETPAVFSNTKFLELSPAAMTLILKSRNLNLPEADIFQIAVKWSGTSKERQDMVLQSIEFKSMTADEYMNNVEPLGGAPIDIPPSKSHEILEYFRKRMLGTVLGGATKVTRRNSAGIRCRRWSNKVAHLVNTEAMEHALLFKVHCNIPQCYLLSVQVTDTYLNTFVQRSHGDDGPSLNHRLANVSFTLSDEASGKVLIHLDGMSNFVLESYYYNIELPDLLPMTNGAVYRIAINMPSIPEDDVLDELKMSYSIDSSAKVNCGDAASVEFMDASNAASNFTTTTRGLIKQLVFTSHS